MTDIELSRRFWERVIATIEVLMFIGMGFLLYFLGKTFTKWGIAIDPSIGVVLQIVFVGLILYLNKVFMSELDRRLPFQR